MLNSFQSISDQLKLQQINNELSKGGKKKSSQGAQTKPQSSTSSHIPPRNTGRPQVHCSACGSKDHLRKDCQKDTFCTRCRSRSHTTEICHALTKQEKDDNICIYCGSKSHTSGKCTSRTNDNREEPRSTPSNLQECRFENTGNSNCFFDQNRSVITRQDLIKKLIGNTHLTTIAIPIRFHSRPGSKHHTVRSGQYTTQISRNHGSKPEESVGGIQ